MYVLDDDSAAQILLQQTVIHNKQIERLSDSYNSDMLMG